MHRLKAVPSRRAGWQGNLADNGLIRILGEGRPARPRTSHLERGQSLIVFVLFFGLLGLHRHGCRPWPLLPGPAPPPEYRRCRGPGRRWPSYQSHPDAAQDRGRGVGQSQRDTGFNQIKTSKSVSTAVRTTLSYVEVERRIRLDLRRACSGDDQRCRRRTRPPPDWARFRRFTT